MRVLIVEDEAALGDIFRDFLVGVGHQADVVGSAEAALARLRHEPPDAVLLDVQLPGMSGLEFLRRPEVREAGVAVVVVSGVATEPQARECLRLGAIEFLPKPVSLDLLAAVLDYLRPFAELSREDRRRCERRHAERRTVDLPVRALSRKGVEWRGACVELSATGMRAVLNGTPRAGSTVRLWIGTPGGGPPVDVLALVIRASTDGAAFWFLDLPAHELQRLLAAAPNR